MPEREGGGAPREGYLFLEALPAGTTAAAAAAAFVEKFRRTRRRRRSRQREGRELSTSEEGHEGGGCGRREGFLHLYSGRGKIYINYKRQAGCLQANVFV